MLTEPFKPFYIVSTVDNSDIFLESVSATVLDVDVAMRNRLLFLMDEFDHLEAKKPNLIEITFSFNPFIIGDMEWFDRQSFDPPEGDSLFVDVIEWPLDEELSQERGVYAELVVTAMFMVFRLYGKHTDSYCWAESDIIHRGELRKRLGVE